MKIPSFRIIIWNHRTRILPLTKENYLLIFKNIKILMTWPKKKAKMKW